MKGRRFFSPVGATSVNTSSDMSSSDSNSAKDRVMNFAAGPSALPLSVLETIQKELLNYHGTGMSVLEYVILLIPLFIMSSIVFY